MEVRLSSEIDVRTGRLFLFSICPLAWNFGGSRLCGVEIFLHALFAAFVQFSFSGLG